MPRPRRSAARAVLVTGGAGYIGSHVVVDLVAAGHEVVALDNFENAARDVPERIAAICGREVPFVEADVGDRAAVEATLRAHGVGAVVHLAGKKVVGESVSDPLLYFHDNLNGAISLLRAMRDVGAARLVFSSSASVYGMPETLPIAESAPTCVLNPYGRTKLMIEDMIDDLAVAWSGLRAISLRYFNPVGAHPSALIGEAPRGVPTNLFPYVAQTAAGLRERVQVHGGDYPTPDGTGVRDFIHVADLASGHVGALALLFSDGAAAQPPHQRINLGTGRGYSVLEVIEAFARVSDRPVPFTIVGRRPGDAPASLADPSRARTVLGWSARHDLEAMCRDHWAYQTRCIAPG